MWNCIHVTTNVGPEGGAVIPYSSVTVWNSAINSFVISAFGYLVTWPLHMEATLCAEIRKLWLSKPGS